MVGVGYAVLTAVNGGSELLISDRRPAPSADCWCCEAHATSCLHTTGRDPRWSVSDAGWSTRRAAEPNAQ
jgi:hypothetical protein